jgi:N-acetylglucosaminyl-diphospho-decaprenol L-rhamnosyltransferase
MHANSTQHSSQTPNLAGQDLDLLVVILNYNTSDLLRNCLLSLREQRGLKFKTCVVDNASPDASADMVAAEFPEVTLIRNPHNNGYSAGNNLGLRAFGFPEAGQARHAMLLNPDTVVPPGALAGLVSFIDAHDDVGIVGPRLLLADGTLDKACRRSFPTPAVSFFRLSKLGVLFPKSRLFNSYNMGYLDERLQTDVDAVVGACIVLRGAALQKCGLLDEQFFMYGEDLDWCLRIKQAGWRVVYVPDVIVHHIKRAASRLSTKANYEFQRAMWLFYKKHYQPGTSKPVDWLVRLGLGLRGGAPLRAEMRTAAQRSG